MLRLADDFPSKWYIFSVKECLDESFMKEKVMNSLQFGKKHLSLQSKTQNKNNNAKYYKQ